MKKLMIAAPGISMTNSVASVRMMSLIKYLDNYNYNIYIVTNKNDKSNLYKSSKIKYFYVSGILETAGLAPFKHNRDIYMSAVKKVINEHNIDIAVVSMGPFYTYKLAGLLKKNNIFTIMDFRDPWVFDIREKKNYYNPKNLLSLGMKIPMERSCIYNASKVVTVTEGWINSFRKFYPLMKNKFMLIKNGYDDAVLDGIDFPEYEKEPGNKLSIGVFGKLFYYTEEYSQVFLDGAKNYVEKCNVEQVGEREECIDSLLNKNSMSLDFINSTGFIPYDDGMKKLSTFDSYMIIDCRKDAIGTKIYDYIYFGKPIIYVGPKDSAIAKIVSGLGNSFVCSTAGDVKKALEVLTSGNIEINKSNRKYSRTEQNKIWRKLFEKVKI